MPDTELIEARTFIHGGYYFTDAGPFGKEFNDPFARESWINTGVNESNVDLGDKRFSEGMFAAADQHHNVRLQPRTAQGSADDAFGYYFLTRKVRLSNIATPFSVPVGLYFRAQVRIENINLSSMVEAIVGFSEQGNIVVDRVPTIAFRAIGAGNWFARVQTDDSGSPVTEDTDTGADTTTSRLLEIVIRPGETRFYVDDSLVKQSLLVYPTGSAAAKVDSYLRRPGFFIAGDNTNDNQLKFGYWTVRSFPIVD